MSCKANIYARCNMHAHFALIYRTPCAKPVHTLCIQYAQALKNEFGINKNTTKCRETYRLISLNAKYLSVVFTIKIRKYSRIGLILQAKTINFALSY